MSLLPLLLCSALMTLDDDRVGSTRQGSLLVCPPVGGREIGGGGGGSAPFGDVGCEAELVLVHDHPNDIAIRLLVRGSIGQYELSLIHI